MGRACKTGASKACLKDLGLSFTRLPVLVSQIPQFILGEFGVSVSSRVVGQRGNVRMLLCLLPYSHDKDAAHYILT